MNQNPLKLHSDCTTAAHFLRSVARAASAAASERRYARDMAAFICLALFVAFLVLLAFAGEEGGKLIFAALNVLLVLSTIVILIVSAFI